MLVKAVILCRKEGLDEMLRHRRDGDKYPLLVAVDLAHQLAVCRVDAGNNRRVVVDNMLVLRYIPTIAQVDYRAAGHQHNQHEGKAHH